MKRLTEKPLLALIVVPAFDLTSNNLRFLPEGECNMRFQHLLFFLCVIELFQLNSSTVCETNLLRYTNNRTQKCQPEG